MFFLFWTIVLSDFYAYSCGRWDRSHIIPEDNYAYTTFDEKREKLYSDTRRLLEQPVNDDDIPAFRQIKTLYASCVNISKSRLETRD